MLQICLELPQHFADDRQRVIHIDASESVETLLQRIAVFTDVNLVYGWFTIDDSKYRAIREEDLDRRVKDLHIHSKLVYRERIGGAPKACLWADYILCSSIRPNDHCVAWSAADAPAISICFKPYRSYTPKYKIDCSSLCNVATYGGFQNSWERYWRNEGNNDVIYRWSPEQFCHRTTVMLLELRTDLPLEKLDEIRYTVFGCNASYYGGEYNSWQRYTYKMPIPCTMTFGAEHITVTPTQGLSPNKWHALALLNTGISGYDDHRIPPIYDDHLIPFLTNDASACQRACWALMIICKRMGQYYGQLGRIICRGYVWPERFDADWGMASHGRSKKRGRK